MSPFERFRPPDRQHRWYVLTIGVVIAALTVSVATRNSIPRIAHSIETQAQSTQAVRQHLDTDAAEWGPPAARIVSEVVTFCPPVSPGAPPIPRPLEENLYNRPPPSC